MNQYPHFLFAKQVIEATQDAEGNWTTGSESWVFHSICREQSNGRGSVINGQDGKAILFKSLIHLPSTAKRLNENTEILVSETNNSTGAVRVKRQILKFDVGQLHNRLWV